MRRPVPLRYRLQEGQALVLGALAMFFLALVLMMSFNLSQAVHEKIRLQQHSDSLAYSMAVVEARAFNYFAVSNRAIAASYAAMTSLHAYMAVASVEADMLQAAAINYLEIMAIEVCLCCCFCPPTAPCCRPSHCIHALQAARIAFKYNSKSRDYAKRAKAADRAFARAQNALDAMVDAIYASQVAVMAQTALALSGRAGLEKLKEVNAPRASDLPMAVAGLNVAEMCQAINGAFPCGSSRTFDYQVMTEVANATRPKWATRRKGTAIPGPLYMHPQFLNDLQRTPGGGIAIVLNHKGTAKVTTGTSRGNLHSTRQHEAGKSVGADEHGGLLSISPWWHSLGYWTYEAEVWSNKGSGKHKPGSTHTNGHKFREVRRFINFQPKARPDFNQPSVYAYVTQDLRVNERGQQGPWELNAQGRVSITHGEQGTGTMNLVPQDEGAAMSKALVYYHRLGDWREHPNLFMPYWRAKLHPFGRAEAALVAGAAGNLTAAQLAPILPTP